MIYKTFKSFLRHFAIGVPIAITFIDCVGYVAKVEGISMQPALNPDVNTTDYVLLNRWGIRNFHIKRGDVVSLFSPRDPDQKIIKRVIALEGDLIRKGNEHEWSPHRNGIEEEGESTIGYKQEFIKIPEGHCWVEGDHRGFSMDSNFFGPVALGLLNARASHIVWPPRRWSRVYPCIPDGRKPLNLLLTPGEEKFFVDPADS